MKYPRYPEYRPSGVDWLGEVPAHWGVKRLKFACELAGEKIDEMPDDGRYLALEHIESWTGRCLQVDAELKPESQTNRFQAGDVLFGKLRPYLAKAWRADFDGYASGELLVLRQREMVPDFAKYFCLSRGFIDLVNSSTYGSKMPRASWDFIGNQMAIIPPLEEQRAIAAFLDRETARIDALIATKRRFIALLQEKRAALISRAVTRGLDSDAPLKESGVTWFPMIPVHWEILPIKRRWHWITSGSRGWATHYSDEGSLFIRIGNLTRTGIDLDLSDTKFVDPPDNSEGERTAVQPGDLLLSITAFLGSVAVAPANIGRAYVSQHVALVRPVLEVVDSRWLAYCLFSDAGKAQLEMAGYGGTKVQLGLEDVADIVVPIPPKHEQKQIAHFLDRRLDALSETIRTVEAAIDRLTEHRVSLITAGVTGKIDTRKPIKKRNPSRHPRAGGNPRTLSP